MFLPKKKLNKPESKKKHELQNPKILEVNLIKEEAEVFFDWNKHLLILVLVFALAGLLLAEIYIGLNWWEKQEAAQIQILSDNVMKIDAEAGKLRRASIDALSYKDKSAAFTYLLDNHIYWSNLFAWMEKNTLSSVHFSSFSGKLDGIYSFSGTADSYADVSWQVKVFSSDPLTRSVDVISVTSAKDKTGAGTVSFNINLKVDPSIFKK